uniref:Secreted protein n=1 Tax=Timema shepardi TaxID=629360 RepID=A0A7R9BA13_TIMSH|nr:unnamed protein product [Timema shepardi]
MNLLDLFILFLLALLGSRWFKELLRVAGNYLTDHKHVGHGNPRAHNVRRATCPATPTLRVKAPRIKHSRKVTPLRSEDPPNHAPYVPAYKLFFPAGAPPRKQFFRPVAPRRVFEPEACNPYVPAYKLFFKNSQP